MGEQDPTAPGYDARESKRRRPQSETWCRLQKLPDAWFRVLEVAATSLQLEGPAGLEAGSEHMIDLHHHPKNPHWSLPLLAQLERVEARGEGELPITGWTIRRHLAHDGVESYEEFLKRSCYEV